MADIFVSYSRADEKRVEMLVRALEAHSISVWWDRSLEQGAGFATLIRDEIAQAKAVVVCWSEAAASSRWVQSEADEADHHQKYVGAFISPGRAPPPFNTLNNANLQDWNGAADDRRLLALLRDVGRRIGRNDVAGLAEAEETRLAEQERRAKAAAEVQRVAAERDKQAKAAAAARARLGGARGIFFVIVAVIAVLPVVTLWDTYSPNSSGDYVALRSDPMHLALALAAGVAVAAIAGLFALSGLPKEHERTARDYIKAYVACSGYALLGFLGLAAAAGMYNFFSS